MLQYIQCNNQTNTYKYYNVKSMIKYNRIYKINNVKIYTMYNQCNIYNVIIKQIHI